VSQQIHIKKNKSAIQQVADPSAKNEKTGSMGWGSPISLLI
jgi:hypothetical protein